MVVEPIFGGQEVQKAQNVKRRDTEKRSDAAQVAKSNDSVEISGKAREASKVHEAISLVKAAPEQIRKDKIEAAKERIMGQNYLSPKVVDDIAEKIARLLVK